MAYRGVWIDFKYWRNKTLYGYIFQLGGHKYGSAIDLAAAPNGARRLMTQNAKETIDALLAV